MENCLYTVAEVAEILKVNVNKVYELIKTGHLLALKLGRYKITQNELKRFLEDYNGKDLTDLSNVVEIDRQAM